jgi:integrase
MRGSPYHIVTHELIPVIFQAGAKKTERIDPNHPSYGKVSSFRTMDAYKQSWLQLMFFLKGQFHLSDPEKIDEEHIRDFMVYKTLEYPSKLYLARISAALGKLETALRFYTRNKYGEEENYDFSIRQTVLDGARNLNLVADNYRDRAYEKPNILTSSLTEPLHRLSGQIQWESGGRIEAVGLIKKEQLRGYCIDPITGVTMGQIWSKEKGGREGMLMVLTPTYNWLKEHIEEYGRFKIDRQKYTTDIRRTCENLGIKGEGSHGFRYAFARRRMKEYMSAGYTYEQNLQSVSLEMKHNRAKITTHYLGG